MQRQTSFFRYVHRLRARLERGSLSLDEAELLRQIDDLIIQELPNEVNLRRAFASLACTESITALRAIEQILPELSGVKREWALLAELQLRMAVMGDLLGERQVALSSGLGGLGTLIRINGILVSQGCLPWQNYQRELISAELAGYCQPIGGNVEEETWGECFYIFVLLVPYTCDIMTLLDDCIRQCNQYGQFIQKNCMVTNIQKLTVSDALLFVEEMRGTSNSPMTLPQSLFDKHDTTD